MSQVKAVTSRLTLMDVDLALLQQAAAIPPVELRSLDAIHLATVASLAADIGAFVTYDRELGSAGEAAGLLKISPA